MIPTHFPHRKPPHDKPFLAALYFRDPFWGREREDYCSAECSVRGHAP